MRASSSSSSSSSSSPPFCMLVMIWCLDFLCALIGRRRRWCLKCKAGTRSLGFIQSLGTWLSAPQLEQTLSLPADFDWLVSGVDAIWARLLLGHCYLYAAFMLIHALSLVSSAPWSLTAVIGMLFFSC